MDPTETYRLMPGGKSIVSLESLRKEALDRGTDLCAAADCACREPHYHVFDKTVITREGLITYV